MSGRLSDSSLFLSTLGAEQRASLQTSASSHLANVTHKDGDFSAELGAARDKKENSHISDASKSATKSTSVDDDEKISKTDYEEFLDKINKISTKADSAEGDDDETIPYVNIAAYHQYISALAQERLFGRTNTMENLTDTDKAVLGGILDGTSIQGIQGIEILEEYRNHEFGFDAMVQKMYAQFVDYSSSSGTLVEADAASQEASLIEAALDQLTDVSESNEAERSVSSLGIMVEQTVESTSNGNAKYKSLNEDSLFSSEPDSIIQVFTAQVNNNTAKGAEFVLKAETPLPAEATQTIFDGMLEQIQTAVTDEKSEMMIQLKPDVLGGLAIHLSMTEEGLSAQVRASNQNVQSVVNSQIAQLEDSLRERGIEVVNIDVVFDQMANQQQMSQQRQQWYGNDEGGSSSGSNYARVEETLGSSVETIYENMGVFDDADENGVVYSA